MEVEGEGAEGTHLRFEICNKYRVNGVYDLQTDRDMLVSGHVVRRDMRLYRPHSPLPRFLLALHPQDLPDVRTLVRMLQSCWLQFRQLQRPEIVTSVTTSMLCSPREMPPYSKTNCRTGTLASIYLIEKTSTNVGGEKETQSRCPAAASQ
jgi:hypothetical protein